MKALSQKNQLFNKQICMQSFLKRLHKKLKQSYIYGLPEHLEKIVTFEQYQRILNVATNSHLDIEPGSAVCILKKDDNSQHQWVFIFRDLQGGYGILVESNFIKKTSNENCRALVRLDIESCEYRDFNCIKVSKCHLNQVIQTIKLLKTIKSPYISFDFVLSYNVFEKSNKSDEGYFIISIDDKMPLSKYRQKNSTINLDVHLKNHLTYHLLSAVEVLHRNNITHGEILPKNIYMSNAQSSFPTLFLSGFDFIVQKLGVFSNGTSFGSGPLSPETISHLKSHTLLSDQLGAQNQLSKTIYEHSKNLFSEQKEKTTLQSLFVSNDLWGLANCVYFIQYNRLPSACLSDIQNIHNDKFLKSLFSPVFSYRKTAKEAIYTFRTLNPSYKCESVQFKREQYAYVPLISLGGASGLEPKMYNSLVYHLFNFLNQKMSHKISKNEVLNLGSMQVFYDLNQGWKFQLSAQVNETTHLFYSPYMVIMNKLFMNHFVYDHELGLGQAVLDNSKISTCKNPAMMDNAWALGIVLYTLKTGKLLSFNRQMNMSEITHFYSSLDKFPLIKRLLMVDTKKRINIAHAQQIFVNYNVNKSKNNLSAIRQRNYDVKTKKRKRNLIFKDMDCFLMNNDPRQGVNKKGSKKRAKLQEDKKEVVSYERYYSLSLEVCSLQKKLIKMQSEKEGSTLLSDRESVFKLGQLYHQKLAQLKKIRGVFKRNHLYKGVLSARLNELNKTITLSIESLKKLDKNINDLCVEQSKHVAFLKLGDNDHKLNKKMKDAHNNRKKMAMSAKMDIERVNWEIKFILKELGENGTVPRETFEYIDNYLEAKKQIELNPNMSLDYEKSVSLTHLKQLLDKSYDDNKSLEENIALFFEDPYVKFLMVAGGPVGGFDGSRKIIHLDDPSQPILSVADMQRTKGSYDTQLVQNFIAQYTQMIIHEAKNPNKIALYNAMNSTLAVGNDVIEKLTSIIEDQAFKAQFRLFTDFSEKDAESFRQVIFDLLKKDDTVGAFHSKGLSCGLSPFQTISQESPLDFWCHDRNVAFGFDRWKNEIFLKLSKLIGNPHDLSSLEADYNRLIKLSKQLGARMHQFLLTPKLLDTYSWLSGAYGYKVHSVAYNKKREIVHTHKIYEAMMLYLEDPNLFVDLSLKYLMELKRHHQVPSKVIDTDPYELTPINKKRSLAQLQARIYLSPELFNSKDLEFNKFYSLPFNKETQEYYQKSLQEFVIKICEKILHAKAIANTHSLKFNQVFPQLTQYKYEDSKHIQQAVSHIGCHAHRELFNLSEQPPNSLLYTQLKRIPIVHQNMEHYCLAISSFLTQSKFNVTANIGFFLEVFRACAIEGNWHVFVGLFEYLKSVYKDNLQEIIHWPYWLRQSSLFQILSINETIDPRVAPKENARNRVLNYLLSQSFLKSHFKELLVFTSPVYSLSALMIASLTQNTHALTLFKKKGGLRHYPISLYRWLAVSPFLRLVFLQNRRNEYGHIPGFVPKNWKKLSMLEWMTFIPLKDEVQCTPLTIEQLITKCTSQLSLDLKICRDFAQELQERLGKEQMRYFLNQWVLSQADPQKQLRKRLEFIFEQLEGLSIPTSSSKKFRS